MPDHFRKLREEEQRDAARLLGVNDVVFLRYPDCEVEDTRGLRLDHGKEHVHQNVGVADDVRQRFQLPLPRPGGDHG